MTAVLFAPHNDDETLFAFYQILRHRPKVVIVLASAREEAQGGPTHAEREQETRLAMQVAAVEWEQWGFLDDRQEWAAINHRIHHEIHTGGYDTVIAPAFELGGHEDHNEVARAVNVFETLNEVRYLTYKRGFGRSDDGTEVIPTADERILKDVALACYQSQKAWGPTAPWFGPDQREFIL